MKIKDTRGISRNNETERTTQVWRKTEQRNYNRVIKFNTDRVDSILTIRLMIGKTRYLWIQRLKIKIWSIISFSSFYRFSDATSNRSI